MPLAREPLNEITLGRVPLTPPVRKQGWRNMTRLINPNAPEEGEWEPPPGDPGNGGGGGTDPEPWTPPAMSPGDIGLLDWEDDVRPTLLNEAQYFSGPTITQATDGSVELRNPSSWSGPTATPEVRWPDTQGFQWHITMPWVGPYYNLVLSSSYFSVSLRDFGDGFLSWAHNSSVSGEPAGSGSTYVPDAEYFRWRRAGLKLVCEASGETGTWYTVYTTPDFGTDEQITLGKPAPEYTGWSVGFETASNNDIRDMHGIQVNPSFVGEVAPPPPE